ncbi:MAG: hypothetical protein ACYTEO_09865 [Planctomycetota bacterium]
MKNSEKSDTQSSTRIENRESRIKKLELSTPVQYIKGVGPARARTFAQLGVYTVGDLLEYFPRDWNFSPEPVKISQMQPNRTVTIIGMVESTGVSSRPIETRPGNNGLRQGRFI